jgi:hypothetical protein
MQTRAPARNGLLRELGLERLCSFGKFQTGPDVHVDDDPDDVENLVIVEVVGQMVVIRLK